ncbi:hypothetical protein, partial [Streptomyces celluloflavus]|uniref:hypothetical protein n=1 Tax=Streptomyces celluloflavus TaxID=58344 RepID=UPI0036CD0D71
ERNLAKVEVAGSSLVVRSEKEGPGHHDRGLLRFPSLPFAPFRPFIRPPPVRQLTFVIDCDDRTHCPEP